MGHEVAKSGCTQRGVCLCIKSSRYIFNLFSFLLCLICPLTSAWIYIYFNTRVSACLLSVWSFLRSSLLCPVISWFLPLLSYSVLRLCKHCFHGCLCFTYSPHGSVRMCVCAGLSR